MKALLPWQQRHRRADIFIARASGARWSDLARFWGLSITRIRQLDEQVEGRVFAAADRRFPGPPEPPPAPRRIRPLPRWAAPGASRMRRRILARARELGLDVESLEWTPLGQHMEMAGQDGGWVLKADNCGIEDWCVGHNVAELLTNMQAAAYKRNRDGAVWTPPGKTTHGRTG